MDSRKLRNLRIGDILKEEGIVTDEQIVAALDYQKSHKGVRLGGALIAMGAISEGQMLNALAKRLDIEKVDIASVDVDIECVEMIPRQLAEKYQMLALKKEDASLLLALNDPMNFYGIEDIRQTTGMNLQLCLVEEASLKSAIQFYYAEADARRAAKLANQSYEAQEEEEEFAYEEDENDDTPIIKLLSRLITRAYSTNTSDIHLEPFENKTIVRMRIDGSIVEYVTLQKSMHAPLIARIKILGELDIAERRIPQDGHFRMKVENDYVNIRVSILPTVFGEKAVLRLLSNNTKIDYPSTFGMEDDDYKKMVKMMNYPNGIIYFTGPTGSGKTTTLYMILEEMAKRTVNISTIEDPVEKNLPKINQTQVNTQAGLTFEVGLRALLRQDPDIIMVGETRDFETASISVRAAITGHLVFSTMHTNDATSTVVRLEDMGLLPYLVSSSLVGVIAQRLMRKLCPECAQDVMATPEEQMLLHHEGEPVKIRKKVGCPSCNYTGYKGRIAIHEILMIDKEVREMILKGASVESISAYAQQAQSMRTLGQCGIELVEKGITTIEELMKVSFYE